ncbi:hypothetical protein AAFC00_006524 [Neodothiora populina]|uniref:Proteinase n=1 Tax=Neodothiora populina TaxID=2781224 RepID=A0ABR3PAI1_9PEZI
MSGEKSGLSQEVTNGHTDGRNTRSSVFWPRKSILVTAACLLSLAAFRTHDWVPAFKDATTVDQGVMSPLVIEKDGSDFSWHSIVPSSELIYHKCFDDYECARLDVPMDWLRKDDAGSKVAVAVIRLPAKVPVTDPRYGGAILTNPGGPGGSGVEQVKRNGMATQAIVDSEIDPNATNAQASALYHDIIGFDPRGIGRTTPGIQCFPDSMSREAWGMQNEALGLLGSSEDSFFRNWHRSRALAEGCSLRSKISFDGPDAIGEHVNSSPVARDMLEIVERHAQWVEKQGRSAQIAHDLTSGRDVTQSIARRTRRNQGKEKIRYWGNSYGTLLGQTFAAMFPDRIDRMVLDGVVDSHDYYFGSWLSNLKDSDKILDRFFQYCSEAGPQDCNFFSEGGPDKIRKEYEDLLLDIFAHPRVVPSSPTRGPDVITWSDVKSTVRLGMYQPLIFMPMVADLLTDVWRGNGSLFADFKHVEHTPSSCSCPSTECQAAGPFSQECNTAYDNGADASMAILCTDAEGLGDVDERGFQAYWHALQNQSSVLGDWWSHTRLSCIGWQARAKWRFTGPFGANATSHPILFIGNTLDPVTPLDNAQRMAENYRGSSLLVQDSEGHTSWSSPSLCTAKVARTYFQTGVVPEVGTVCDVLRRPFQEGVDVAAYEGDDDKVLVRALEVMQKTYMELKWGSRSMLS